MTLQQAIDETRQELIRSFQPKKFKYLGHCENYCKKEIKKAFKNAHIDTISRDYFGKNPFYEMIENAFVWKAISKCMD